MFVLAHDEYSVQVSVVKRKKRFFYGFSDISGSIKNERY